jgi:hypothetical protein
VDLHCLPHVELRNAGAEPSQAKASDLFAHSDQKGAGVVRCTKGAMSRDESDEVVEVRLQIASFLLIGDHCARVRLSFINGLWLILYFHLPKYVTGIDFFVKIGND